MTRRPPSGDDPLLEDGSPDASTVALRRVRPSVRRLTPEVVAASDEPAAEPVADMAAGAHPVDTRGAPPSGRSVVTVALAVVFAVLAVSSGELRVAALLLFGVASVSVLRVIDHRTQLSFGQGFIGYRADGWPVGVQEDDDVHWSWRSTAGGASDTEPELEIRDRR